MTSGLAASLLRAHTSWHDERVERAHLCAALRCCLAVRSAQPLWHRASHVPPPGLRFALPFTEHVAASDAAEAPWISESFIRHRNQRWSITPNYPAADPQLKVRASENSSKAACFPAVRPLPEHSDAQIVDHPCTRLRQC